MLHAAIEYVEDMSESDIDQLVPIDWDTINMTDFEMIISEETAQSSRSSAKSSKDGDDIEVQFYDSGISSDSLHR